MYRNGIQGNRVGSGKDAGEVAERLKAPLSKSGILSKTGSWVRIPPSPPLLLVPVHELPIPMTA